MIGPPVGAQQKATSHGDIDLLPSYPSQSIERTGAEKISSNSAKQKDASEPTKRTYDTPVVSRNSSSPTGSGSAVVVIDNVEPK